jgi:hypothetical protein
VLPEAMPQYEIVLRHWRLGEAHFLFSCTRPRKLDGSSIEVFGRRCKVTGSADSLPTGLRENAARRFLPLRNEQKDQVPGFYWRGNRFFVEASWTVDGRGKPRRVQDDIVIQSVILEIRTKRKLAMGSFSMHLWFLTQNVMGRRGATQQMRRCVRNASGCSWTYSRAMWSRNGDHMRSTHWYQAPDPTMRMRRCVASWLSWRSGMLSLS